jgi:hypothetical protein
VTDDIDSGLLKILTTTYLSNGKFAEDIQKWSDQQAAEVVADLEKTNDEQKSLIKVLSVELGKAKKARDKYDTAYTSAMEIIRLFSLAEDSIIDSKNPVKRLLAHWVKWPDLSTDYDRAKNRTLAQVLGELHLQDMKWGPARQQPNGTGPRFNFDAGLADHYRQITNENFANGRGTWADILTEEFYEAMAEENPRKLKAELIQVAAVAVAWVVSLTLQKKK